MAGILLLPWGGRIRRRLGGRALMSGGLLLAIVTTGALLGCGSSTRPPVPQAQSYAVTLTATSGTVTNSTTLHLTVQ